MASFLVIFFPEFSDARGLVVCVSFFFIAFVVLINIKSFRVEIQLKLPSGSYEDFMV